MWILGDFDERLDGVSADQVRVVRGSEALALSAPAQYRTQEILASYSSYVLLWSSVAVSALLLLVR